MTPSLGEREETNWKRTRKNRPKGRFFENAPSGKTKAVEIKNHLNETLFSMNLLNPIVLIQTSVGSMKYSPRGRDTNQNISFKMSHLETIKCSSKIIKINVLTE